MTMDQPERNKRRQRRRLQPPPTKEDLLHLQQEKYDRLLYQMHKQLHKQAKLVKNVLVQKEIKRCPQQPQRDNNSNNTQSQSQQEGTANSSSNGKLQRLKGVDLDLVTQQAIRQLGLYHSNPCLKGKAASMAVPTEEVATSVSVAVATKSDSIAADASGGNDDVKRSGGNGNTNKNMSPIAIPAALPKDHASYEVINSILTHKRLSQAMEEWNEKVTEFRQWCMEVEAKAASSIAAQEAEAESQHNEGGRRPNHGKSSKKRKKEPNNNNIIKNNQRGRNEQQQDQEQQDFFDRNLQHAYQEPSAMFVTLNNSTTTTGDGAAAAAGDGDIEEPKKKKNRMGQRARKAKAMAIQAKQEGRTEYESLNWRAPKAATHNNNNDDDANDASNNNNNNNNNNNRNRRNTKLPQKRDFQANTVTTDTSAAAAAHPSWAAKQAQSTGIVAFQGKKITFD